MKKNKFVLCLVVLSSCLALSACGKGAKYQLQFHTPAKEDAVVISPLKELRLQGAPGVLWMRKGEVIEYGPGTLPAAKLVVDLENVGDRDLVLNLGSTGLANALYSKQGSPGLSRIRPAVGYQDGEVHIQPGEKYTLRFKDIGRPPVYLIVTYGLGGDYVTDVIRIEREPGVY